MSGPCRLMRDFRLACHQEFMSHCGHHRFVVREVWGGIRDIAGLRDREDAVIHASVHIRYSVLCPQHGYVRVDCGPNVAGVIGSAIAAGVFLSLFS